MPLPRIGMLDGKLEDTNPCINHARAKAWLEKKKKECSGRETTGDCRKALDTANVDEIQRGQAAKGCSGGRRRRKTRRSRRRDSRAGTLRRRFRGGVIGPNLKTYLALDLTKRAEWFAKRTIDVKEKMAKEYRQLTPEETESVVAQLEPRPEPPPNENPRRYNPTVTQFLPGGRRRTRRRR